MDVKQAREIVVEAIRADEQQRINAVAAEREPLEIKHGKVWNTEELQKDFTVLGFLAPYVVVQRREDGKKGSLQFQHMPRYYFNWAEDA